MATLSAYTVANLVTEALKRGGIVNPTSAQITNSTDYHLREVTKDIHLFTGGAPQLTKLGVDTCVVGQSEYPWPTDALEIESVVLLDAPDDWRGTATAGGATSITLAAGLSVAEGDIQGKRIVITGGTGVDQINQITAWNNSTKVATVVDTWTTNPASGSTYAIANYHLKVWSKSKPYAFDLQLAPYAQGYPEYGAMVGQEIWLNRAPDRAYMLWWSYWPDLDYLDVAGTPYLKFLRDHANVIIEGVAAKVMARYDDDRQGGQLAVYNALLANLAGKQARITQVQFNDV